MATSQQLAQAMRYGPQVQQQMRRSAYLEDALKALSAPQQDIRSPWELAAKLAGVALLDRASGKAKDRTIEALAEDRKSEIARLMAGLPQPAATPAPQPFPPPPSAQAPQSPPMPQAAPQPAPPQPAPQVAPVQPAQPQQAAGPIQGVAPLAWRANVEQESGGNGNAVGKMTKYGRALGSTQMLPATAQAMAQKLGLPWRPEWLIGDTPEELQYQNTLGEAYFNEGLQKYGGDPYKAAMYYHGGPNEAEWGPKTRAHANAVMAKLQRLEKQAQPPIDVAEVAAGAQPFQVAANGPLQPGMIPSAPDSSPSASGAPPVATPQAAAGGNSQQWPNYQPTESEIMRVRSLLEDPRTFDEGRAEALKLQQKMSQPAPAKIVEMNGVQFYVPETPGQGGPPMMIPVPQQAMTRQVDATTINPAAPAGLQAQVDPLGNVKPGIGAPAENMQAIRGPDGQLQYVPIRGSKEDPYRVQAPGPGYQYTPSGTQQAIPGSSADLKSPANVMEGANRFGGMVKTIVDSAMKVKQNYGAVQTGYRQKNGPGDIAMTNGIQKLIDEGVVKGEDVNMQMKSNGLQGTLGGWQQYAASGGLFTDDVRDKIYKTATDLYQNLDRTYQVRIQSLQPGFDEAYGQGAFGRYVFPEAFAAELGWTGERKEQTTPPPEPRPAQIRTLQGIKGYDRNAPLGSPNHPFLAVDDATVQRLDKPENKGKHIVLPNGDLGVID
jgi:hypothetical protein